MDVVLQYTMGFWSMRVLVIVFYDAKCDSVFIKTGIC